MSADSIIALYDFEGQIEPPFARLLEQALIVGGKTVEESRGTKDLITPRIDVVLNMGAQQSHLFPYKGNLMPDLYTAVLIATVVTERDTNSNAANLLRAQLRAFMLTKLTRDPAARQLTNIAIPFHEFSRITEAGTQNVIDDAKNLDYSRVSFNATIGIRQDAWPA
jgi:hypothetical protein